VCEGRAERRDGFLLGPNGDAFAVFLIKFLREEVLIKVGSFWESAILQEFFRERIDS
jgi:hypothetical protein